jgi:NAD(P)-dependent dehydrogenase (short-subunit alcohol dehydrogenase family)
VDIGRATAVAFAKKGAKVVVAGRRDEAGKARAKELRSFGSEAEFINADVRKDDDVRNMVDKTVARFGRLDVAVNNATTEGAVGPITDQTAETFGATFETNVLGERLGLRQILRRHYTPWTNGKAERFIQTALREWAYARAYQNSDQRSVELFNRLHRYNWHRPQGSLKAHMPISRLGLSEDDLLRLDS